MRRKRNNLQVSTFPFLAVLLCAMGSLLLLLFIMDRRAKIAARYRVTEEFKTRQARTKAEEAARKAEWDKARESLHLSLLASHGQVHEQSKSVSKELDDINRKLAASKDRQADLHKHVRDEAGKITLLQLEIESQHNRLTQTDRKEASSRADLLEAAKELADLELAFQHLKKVRENDKQTYSVVPYRGKRGDARPPIYVECQRNGVMFHPEKKRLGLVDCTPDALRGEVERRHGPLAIQKLSNDRSTAQPTGPYVLFLIRPDGIASYYKTQSALRGYQLEFGYELVDAEWVLDFNAQGSGGRSQESGVRGQEAGVRSQGSGGRGQEAGGRSQGSGVRGQESGVRSQGSGIERDNTPGGAAGSGEPMLPAPPAIGMGLHPGVGDGIPARPLSFVPISKNTPPVPIASAGMSGDISPIPVPIPGNSVAGQRLPERPVQPPPGEAVADPTRIPGSPFGSDDNKKPTPAPVLSKVLGNRDFMIVIECRADNVTVSPGGFAYRWASVNPKAAEDALVQTVVNLIARRQASVRPGEPPYRPLIRFRVWPDGLRTYHSIHPLFENLGVPRTRENVEE
ncbi:MAG: hypothetical protein HYR84_16495 [Planctomycetes bacterium]|nr:hypothetical protein [Planctomycetota bacterium]